MTRRSETSVIEAVLRRDRWVTIAGLVVLAGLAWVYVLAGAGTGMNVWSMSTWAFPPPVPQRAMHPSWAAWYWGAMFLMWWIMMIAMMIPSAAPTVLLHARVARHAQKNDPSGGVTDVGTGAFVLGYLVVWGAFSAVATILQWGFERAHVVDGMMMWPTVPCFSAAVLVAAGLYQFSSLKRVCLAHCRSPAQFISENWRTGHFGAFEMGVRHGAFCLGCCWGLMLLLFAGGIMNLVWIAGLSILVMLEKLVPFGDHIASVTGVLLVGVGIVVLAGTI